MKTEKKRISSFSIATIVAVAAFVALSILTDGLIEFSRDIGFLRWIRDLLVYSFTNKLGYKLVISLVFGFGAYFIDTMIVYGMTLKAKKRARTLRVAFTPTNMGANKTA